MYVIFSFARRKEEDIYSPSSDEEAMEETF